MSDPRASEFLNWIEARAARADLPAAGPPRVRRYHQWSSYPPDAAATVGTSVGHPAIVDVAETPVTVRIHCLTPPSGGPLEIDIQWHQYDPIARTFLDPVTIFREDASGTPARPTVQAGERRGGGDALFVPYIQFASEDVLTLDVISANGAAGVSVTLWVLQPAYAEDV